MNLIYRALIHSHLDFCNTAWRTCGINLQNKLQKLQKTVRVLTFSNFEVHAGDLFDVLGWKNLAHQQQIQRATMVYRSLHGLVTDYHFSKLKNEKPRTT